MACGRNETSKDFYDFMTSKCLADFSVFSNVFILDYFSLLVAPSKGVEPPAHRRIPETEFVKTNRDKLIERVSSVMAIADSLMSQDMINSEMYSKVCAADTREKKMRLLLDALDSGGAAVKAEFCRLLKEKEPYLANDLGLHL